MRPELIIISVFSIVSLIGFVYWLALIIFDIFLPKIFTEIQATIIKKNIFLVMNRPDIPEKSSYSYQLQLEYCYEFNKKKYNSTSLNPFNQIRSKNKENIEELFNDNNKYLTVFVNSKKPNISYAFSNTYKYTYVFIPLAIHSIGTIISLFLLITTF